MVRKARCSGQSPRSVQGGFRWFLPLRRNKYASNQRRRAKGNEQMMFYQRPILAWRRARVGNNAWRRDGGVPRPNIRGGTAYG
jgi:hypothetical protein